MTDKVQKIREEVERIFNHVKDSNFEYDSGAFYYFKDLLDFIDSLQEEPVNDDLEKAAITAADEDMQGRQIMEESNENRQLYSRIFRRGFKAGAEWQKEHLWKPADGDDLPEIDREVIALLNNGKVVFAHRPYKGKYIGKNLTTGNIETFENKTYDEGDWNQPDVKWWLDCEWPNKEE